MYSRLDAYMKRYPTPAVFVQEFKDVWHFHGILFRYHHLKEEKYTTNKNITIYQEALNPALDWLTYMDKTNEPKYTYYDKHGDRILLKIQPTIQKYLKKKSLPII